MPNYTLQAIICCVALIPGANVKKTFNGIIYKCSLQARAFVAGNPF